MLLITYCKSCTPRWWFISSIRNCDHGSIVATAIASNFCYIKTFKNNQLNVLYDYGKKKTSVDYKKEVVVSSWDDQ